MYILSSSTKYLLDLLSGSTNVIFAGSVARKLSSAATFAYTAGQKGSGSSLAKILFSGGLADTSILTTLAAGQTSGQQSTGLVILNDQSGNANYMGRPTFSHYCPLTTPGGVINAPTIVSGGTPVPTFSTGYNGLQTAISGPYLTSGSWDGVTNTDLIQGDMAVSFGAVDTFWAYDVIRLNGPATTTATTGSGVDLEFEITAQGGPITAYSIYDAGGGYSLGDTGSLNVTFGAASYTVTSVGAGGSVTGASVSGTDCNTMIAGTDLGRASSFTHTGDTTDNQTTTSACLILRNTAAVGYAQSSVDGGLGAGGIVPLNKLILLGSIFDGTHINFRLNGVPFATVNYSGTLGSGGVYALGEIANVGPFGSNPLNADRVEHLCGTTLKKSDMMIIEANIRAFYGI